MTEMPFPIGANIEGTVNIKDSAGTDILLDSGSLKTIDQEIKSCKYGENRLDVNIGLFGGSSASHLLGKQNIRTLLEHGTFKQFDGQVSVTTTLYTVPANKRVIIYSVSLLCSGAGGNWAFCKGTGLQDRLIYHQSSSDIGNNKIIYIFDENEIIRLEELSGEINMIHNIHGVEVDIA